MANVLSGCDVQYVAAVEPLLHREQQWGERWLPESTRKKCSAVCYTALVAPHRSDLCSCVPSLLRNGQHIPAVSNCFSVHSLILSGLLCFVSEVDLVSSLHMYVCGMITIGKSV
eukprot:SAG31_NODE_42_length_31262_cov_46.416231_17_plen_114_part_00